MRRPWQQRVGGASDGEEKEQRERERRMANNARSGCECATLTSLQGARPHGAAASEVRQGSD